MSSILKALQRVETEKQDLDAPAPGCLIRDDSPLSGRTRKFGFAAFVLILAAAVTTALLFSRDRETMPVHQPRSSLPEPVNRNGVGPDLAGINQGIDKPETTDARQLRFPDKALWVKESEIKEVGENIPAVPPPDWVLKRTMPAGPGPPVAKNEFVEKENPPSKERLFPEEPEIKIDFSGIKPYQKGDMTLQAIAWSETPEDRIAVVNGKVLHEKQMVNSVKIHRINRDDLILDTDNKRFILKMGR